MSLPKVPRFGRSRPDSQFRGIAEVVKEFMEYIADCPLLVHNAKFDMRLGISIVASAAGYQSRLRKTGGRVLGFTRPFHQSGLVLSPFPTDFIDLNGCSIFPSSSDPNLAKRSLLFVLPHHFTFIPPLNFLVQQQFVLLHFSTLNFTFLILQH